MVARLSSDLLIFILIGFGILIVLLRIGRHANDGGATSAARQAADLESPVLRSRRIKQSTHADGRTGLPTIKEISGRAHVIDGDTIVIRRTKIRLSGIDAPELDQPYGQKAKWAMVDICKGQVVTAKLNGVVSYDRVVGTCYLPDGRDIGAELIKRGLALDWTTFSGGKYRNLEPHGARRRLRAGAFKR